MEYCIFQTPSTISYVFFIGLLNLIFSFDMRIVDSLTNLYIAYARFAFLAISPLISLVTLREYNTSVDKYFSRVHRLEEGEVIVEEGKQ